MALDLESVIKEPYTKKTSGIRLFKLVWGFVVLGLWAYTSVHTGGLVALPDSIVTVTLGLFGIGAVARFTEKQSPPTPNTGP